MEYIIQQYQCQSCQSVSNAIMTTNCCYKILCHECYKSINHNCQISYYHPSYHPCSRCLIKLSTKLCKGCNNRKYCNECYSTLHQIGKFQLHIYYQLNTPPNYSPNKQYPTIEHTSRTTQSIKLSSNILNNKNQQQHNTNTIINKLKQIQIKIKLDNINLNQQSINIKQHWNHIINQFNSQLNNIISSINSILFQFNHIILNKKNNNLQNLNHKIKINNTIIHQIQNIIKLNSQNDFNNHNFIVEKTKILLQQSLKKQKFNYVEEVYKNNYITFIHNYIKQLDITKIIIKEKNKKQIHKFVKAPSVQLLDVPAKNNQIIQTQLKSNNSSSYKFQRSFVRQQHQKIQNKYQKLAFCNKKKTIRNTFGPIEYKKKQEVCSLTKHVQYSKCR